jgi:hypothetical protein
MAWLGTLSSQKMVVVSENRRLPKCDARSFQQSDLRSLLRLSFTLCRSRGFQFGTHMSLDRYHHLTRYDCQFHTSRMLLIQCRQVNRLPRRAQHRHCPHRCQGSRRLLPPFDRFPSLPVSVSDHRLIPYQTLEWKGVLAMTTTLRDTVKVQRCVQSLVCSFGVLVSFSMTDKMLV